MFRKVVRSIDRRLVLLFVVVILLITACGGTESAIIGRWSGVNGGSIEFFKDRTIIASDIGNCHHRKP